MLDIVTNRNTTMPSRGLYCVWIRANQNENAPLIRVWIDPSIKTFESRANEQTPAAELAPASPEMSDCEAEGQEASQAHEETGHFRWSFRPVLGFLMLACIQFLAVPSAGAQTAGKVSGIVRDKTGAVIAGATVAAINNATGVKQTTKSDVQGSYSFPVLPIGQYEIEVASDEFKLYRKTGLAIDINSAVVVDVTLQLSEQNQNIPVSVTEEPVQVETTDTQLGEVLGSKQVTEVPLNGRSYTDLFSTQVGVSPITTSGAGNSTSGGGFGTVAVAGNGNTGQFSINGQRESSNGFMLNGASVQESIGQQAGIIPNLDSIAEFRILTSNTDAKYGNYSGGLINVVTKSGGNSIHGSAFEFLRNTNLDSKGFFSPERSTFQQNQYGGTVGGPIRRDKISFFSDYQGQSTVQGLETGLVSVPSLANRAGNFSDPTHKGTVNLTGSVKGAFLAQTLTSRLGYQVNNGEPFYTPNCTVSTCVFPGQVIPQNAFALPATRMLQNIPAPNTSSGQFSSGTEKQRINDNKGAERIDINSMRYGSFSFYYFVDKYNLDNPYPSGLGGATIPGPGGSFDALSNGLDQVFILNHAKSFGSTMVNEAHFSFTRLNNDIGIPKGGVGISLADQGISSGPLGIQQGFPQYAGVEMLYFNSFAVGTNPFFVAHVNNTVDVSGHISKVAGNHTLKFGGGYVGFKVKQLPDLVANGTFRFLDRGINPLEMALRTSFLAFRISIRSNRRPRFTKAPRLEACLRKIAGEYSPISRSITGFAGTT
jgi:hypothetical protein